MNQMKKTLVTLVGLLVVAGAVGLFAWKGVYEPDEKAAVKKDLDERLFGTSSAAREKDAGAAKVDFVKLTVQSGSDTTVLERTPPGPWAIVAPVKAKSDALVVDGLVSQLQTARFKTTIDGEATDAELKTYGLDAPAFTIEAEAVVDGAPKTVKLEGGIENPFDGTFYVRKDGTRRIHMAEGGVRWSLSKTTFDLRDKELLAIDDAMLETVSLKSGANDWSMTRGDDKLWRLTRPEPGLADTTTVNAMLGTWRGTRAVSFITDTSAASLSKLGFDAPFTTIVFTVAGQPVTIRGSLVKEGGQKLYVSREDADGLVVAEVNLETKPELDRNAFDLRDKSLVAFAKTAVTRLSLEAPGTPAVVVERDSADAGLESWHLTSPTSGAAKGYKVATALWTLSATRAGSVVVEKPDKNALELYGLDPKHARVVTLTSSTGTATLRIGKDVVGKPSQAYGVGTRGAIVEFDSTRIGELPWKPSDLLDVPADAGTP